MVIIRRFDPIEYDRAQHHGLPRIDAHIRYQQQNGLCAICQLPTKDDKPLQDWFSENRISAHRRRG